MDTEYILISTDMIDSLVAQLSQAIELSNVAGDPDEFSFAESNGWSRACMSQVRQVLEIHKEMV